MIKLLMLVISLILNQGAQLSAQSADINEDSCITADRITGSLGGWPVVSTQLSTFNKQSVLKVSVHNPLNKAKKSVDAKFYLVIDPSAPTDPSRYTLVGAVYINDDSIVRFKRVYIKRHVMSKNKLIGLVIQTPCFAREVMHIIKFEPVENNSKTPDGGNK